MARRHVGILPLGGMIALCAILLLAPEARSQNLKIEKKKFTISGTIGLSGVSLTGFPGSPPPQTDENGAYSVVVEYGWTGTIKPVKVGYVFEPAQRAYTTRVTSNMSDQDYTPKLLTFTISGSTGLPGVKLTGFATDVISDEKGRYTVTVEYGFSGNISLEKMGYRFEPPSRSYNQVIKNLQEDYKPFEVTFTISGSAGIAGIKMTGLPNDPVTGADGRYSAEVQYGWSGKVTPEKEGCLFTPEYQEYSMVVESLPNQDYTVKVLSYEISGSAGMPGVLMKGFPQDVLTDDNGFYVVSVDHGWSGKVTPEKAGWTFAPPVIEYKHVTASVENQNYNGTVVYLKIEGSTGIGGVVLTGLPGGSVTSDEKGFYNTRVEYGWAGTVIPQKEGYSF